MVVKDRSKDRLKREINESITSMFSKILDYLEVVVLEEPRYKVLRSKVLRFSNDCIRDINKNVDFYYNVEYVPKSEDIIVVNKQGKGN